MEALETPKNLISPGCLRLPTPRGVWRRTTGLHQEKRWRRPTCTCACPSCRSCPILTLATSSPRSQRASTTSNRVMRLTEILGEHLVLLDHISPLRWQLAGMAYLCTLLTTVPPLKHRWVRTIENPDSIEPAARRPILCAVGNQMLTILYIQGSS